tara:strand:- start:70 stop:1092 length:1023 start_codon:yes stop_codon:yes gene_type:complete
MNILVTGALGYIGSNTVIKLIEAGNKLYLLDNLHNSSIDTLDKIEKITKKKQTFLEVDIRDYKEIFNILSNNKIEAIFHFAGLKSVKESENLPKKYFNVNFEGSKNLIDAFNLQKTKKKIFIFSSSACVYGNPEKLPYREDHPLSPENIYGETKLKVESYLKRIASSNSNWQTIVLRYFNPIGAHSSGLFGDNPLNDTPENLMPFISRVALGKLNYLEIFGSDYDTQDGTPVRDYIHIEDLAEGHIAAFNFLKNKENKVYEEINLGKGKGYSVLEVVEAFKKINEINIPYKFSTRRLGDIPEYYSDVEKSKKILGWHAKRTLEEMCRSSWEFEKKLKEIE